MKTIYLLSIFGLMVLFGGGCDRTGGSTAFNPMNADLVIIYDIDPMVVKNYSGQITQVSSYALKHEEVRSLFANTTEESLHIWKGAFLAVVHCKDGKEYHLAISYYGGFARVLETHQSLKFVDSSKVEYERIKNAVVQNVFIPGRQQKNHDKTN